MNSEFLHIEHLTRRFGALKAVDDLSFDVCQGEIFGFLGPNGAGKTTTISMICGLLRPDSGKIRLRGQEPGQDGANFRARVGVCPQTIVVWERLTCLEQLVFIGEAYGVIRKEAHRRGMELLEALGLAEKHNQLAGTLSGGMQRRLNLALALVHDPELLVLDEPEAGLDPQSRVLAREYIRSWARSKPERTVLFTTHNMDEAERLVDRVAIIDRGRLLVLDSPEALKRTFGTGQHLEILLRENDCPPDRILRALNDLAEGAVYTGDTLYLNRPGAAGDLPVVLDRLRALELAPVKIHMREDSLEDVFIGLTGRSLRE